MFKDHSRDFENKTLTDRTDSQSYRVMINHICLLTSAIPVGFWCCTKKTAKFFVLFFFKEKKRWDDNKFSFVCKELLLTSLQDSLCFCSNVSICYILPDKKSSPGFNIWQAGWLHCVWVRVIWFSASDPLCHGVKGGRVITKITAKDHSISVSKTILIKFNYCSANTKHNYCRSSTA